MYAPNTTFMSLDKILVSVFFSLDFETSNDAKEREKRNRSRVEQPKIWRNENDLLIYDYYVFVLVSAHGFRDEMMTMVVTAATQHGRPKSHIDSWRGKKTLTRKQLNVFQINNWIRLGFGFLAVVVVVAFSKVFPTNRTVDIWLNIGCRQSAHSNCVSFRSSSRFHIARAYYSLVAVLHGLLHSRMFEIRPKIQVSTWKLCFSVFLGSWCSF